MNTKGRTGLLAGSSVIVVLCRQVELDVGMCEMF
jgi:hypothetical protein